MNCDTNSNLYVNMDSHSNRLVTYVHTYIRMYIHTYVHTYTQTDKVHRRVSTLLSWTEIKSNGLVQKVTSYVLEVFRKIFSYFPEVCWEKLFIFGSLPENNLLFYGSLLENNATNYSNNNYPKQIKFHLLLMPSGISFTSFVY